MNNKKSVIGLIVMALIMCIGGFVSEQKLSKAADYGKLHKTESWNTGAEEVEIVTGSAFTYKSYPSTDNTKAWIHNIKIENESEPKEMIIPSEINGKTGTKLGEGVCEGYDAVSGIFEY